MPPRKAILNHLANTETYRKPYLTSESYPDFKSRIPLEYVTKQFDKYVESELQQPYEEPSADYPTTENTYYPNHGNDPRMTVNSGNGLPSVMLSCLQLWNKLMRNFPSLTTSSLWKNFLTYASKCPTKFIDNKCCAGVGISGPTAVDSASTTEYYLTGSSPFCVYDWESSQGRIVGGTFTAPTVLADTKVTISVTNLFTGIVCATIKVTVRAVGCSGEGITLTTTQMSTSASQTLSVSGAIPGTTYTWELAAGGGTLSSSTGTSTTYTAPAANANCSNNPTIQLKVSSSVCATVQIAVNGYSPASAQALVDCKTGVAPCTGGGSCSRGYACNGTYSTSGHSVFCDCLGGTWANASIPAEIDSMSRTCAMMGMVDGMNDTRDAAMLAGGCCPAQLL